MATIAGSTRIVDTVSTSFLLVQTTTGAVRTFQATQNYRAGGATVVDTVPMLVQGTVGPYIRRIPGQAGYGGLPQLRVLGEGVVTGC